ncbi:putative reverse transcriptase domain-containing protein [Tanacetum coccineum]
MEKIFDVMGCDDVFKARLAVYKFEEIFMELFFLQFFPRAEQERLKREYHSLRQRAGESSNEFMQRFIRIAGFLGQLTSAARNFEILRDRDDYDRPERSDKRSEAVVETLVGTSTNRKGVASPSEMLPTIGFTSKTRAPSVGYTYPVYTMWTRNTGASSSGHADKKPDASGRVFALTQDQAANATGTITGALFIFGRAVFVLFDTGATHSVISTKFASCCTMTPVPLDHVLCISTPMKDSARITHVYRDLPLQFNDRIRSVNALPLDMCEFDIILGMDWLSAHHATIDCHSRRVIFGNIHTPEFIYHGSLPGKSMKIISALEARARSQSPRPLSLCYDELKRVERSVARVVGARFYRPSVSHGCTSVVRQRKRTPA